MKTWNVDSTTELRVFALNSRELRLVFTCAGIGDVIGVTTLSEQKPDSSLSIFWLSDHAQNN